MNGSVDVVGRRRDHLSDLERAGDFCWLRESAGERVGAIALLCPACGSMHSVGVKPNGGWDWNGDRERPTLTPSIYFKWGHGDHSKNPACRWHGFLTSGVWSGRQDPPPS